MQLIAYQGLGRLRARSLGEVAIAIRLRRPLPVTPEPGEYYWFKNGRDLGIGGFIKFFTLEFKDFNVWEESKISPPSTLSFQSSKQQKNCLIKLLLLG